MRFDEIVKSARPLEQLVRLALSTKGVTVTDGTVDRYTGLLEAAIFADDGDSLDGNVWQGFVAELDGPSKYEGAIHAIGQMLNASSSEIQQFMAVSSATIDALSGVPVDTAEQFLASDLEAIRPTETEPYAHLDDASRIAAEEADRVFGANDDAPSHIESAEGDGDEG